LFLNRAVQEAVDVVGHLEVLDASAQFNGAPHPTHGHDVGRDHNRAYEVEFPEQPHHGVVLRREPCDRFSDAQAQKFRCLPALQQVDVVLGHVRVHFCHRHFRFVTAAAVPQRQKLSDPRLNAVPVAIRIFGDPLMYRRHIG